MSLVKSGKVMKCVICRNGETSAGKVTVSLQRGEAIIVIKGVPADVCDNCGEYYLSELNTGSVLRLAESAVKNGAEIEVLRFGA